MTADRLLYARYQLRDLAAAEVFFTDFGLLTVRRGSKRLLMRGSGEAPWIYEAVQGPEDRFLGVGFEVSSPGDLERLAALHDSSRIEPVDGPGGGHRVRMRMPDGFLIDAVHGFAAAEPLANRLAITLNTAKAKRRVNAPVRVRREIAPVNKLGHFVLHVSDHDASVEWLRQRLGVVASDFMAAPDAPDRPLGSFLRVDAGDKPVDHHCLLVLAAEKIGVHHISFEVEDLDAIMASHDYLVGRGYTLDVGVGRHLMGSQIFDYWRDPFGFRVEHYSDGDVVNSGHRPSTFTGTAAETTQWGAEPPPEFFN